MHETETTITRTMKGDNDEYRMRDDTKHTDVEDDEDGGNDDETDEDDDVGDHDNDVEGVMMMTTTMTVKREMPLCVTM